MIAYQVSTGKMGPDGEDPTADQVVKAYNDWNEGKPSSVRHVLCPPMKGDLAYELYKTCFERQQQVMVKIVMSLTDIHQKIMTLGMVR